MILSAKVLEQSSNKPLILHTDASQYGLGAVMSHIMEDIWLKADDGKRQELERRADEMADR